MKVTYWISTDKVSSKCQDTIEFDDDEWNSMTDEQQEAAVKEVAWGHVDWGYESQPD